MAQSASDPEQAEAKAAAEPFEGVKSQPLLTVPIACRESPLTDQEMIDAFMSGVAPRRKIVNPQCERLREQEQRRWREQDKLKNEHDRLQEEIFDLKKTRQSQLQSEREIATRINIFAFLFGANAILATGSALFSAFAGWPALVVAAFGGLLSVGFWVSGYCTEKELWRMRNHRFNTESELDQNKTRLSEIESSLNNLNLP